MSAGVSPIVFESASAASVRIASARAASAATCCCNWLVTLWPCHQIAPPPMIASTSTAASAAIQTWRLLRRSSDSMRRMVALPTGVRAGVDDIVPVVATPRSWVSGTALRSAVAASALAAATTRVAAASSAPMARVRDGSDAGRG